MYTFFFLKKSATGCQAKSTGTESTMQERFQKIKKKNKKKGEREKMIAHLRNKLVHFLFSPPQKKTCTFN